MENKKKHVIFVIIGIVILVGIIGAIVLSSGTSNNNVIDDPSSNQGEETPVVERQEVLVSDYTVVATHKTDYKLDNPVAKDTSASVKFTIYSFGTVVNNDNRRDSVPDYISSDGDVSENSTTWAPSGEYEAFIIEFDFIKVTKWGGTNLGIEITDKNSKVKVSDVKGYAEGGRVWSTFEYNPGDSFGGFVTVFVDKSSALSDNKLLEFVFYASETGDNVSLSPDNGYVKDLGPFVVNYDNGKVSITPAEKGTDLVRK